MPVEEATDGELLAVHSPAMVRALDALSPALTSPEQLRAADVERHLSPGSLGTRHTGRAARLAAGAAAGMAERLARGEADAGFALVRPAGEAARAHERRAQGAGRGVLLQVHADALQTPFLRHTSPAQTPPVTPGARAQPARRPSIPLPSSLLTPPRRAPPGHLSGRDRAEGGGLYNNVAVAARAAQAAGAGRVMILDWDAHAAVGTAAVFEGDPSVMVVSLHRGGGCVQGWGRGRRGRGACVHSPGTRLQAPLLCPAGGAAPAALAASLLSAITPPHAVPSLFHNPNDPRPHSPPPSPPTPTRPHPPPPQLVLHRLRLPPDTDRPRRRGGHDTQRGVGAATAAAAREAGAARAAAGAGRAGAGRRAARGGAPGCNNRPTGSLWGPGWKHRERPS